MDLTNMTLEHFMCEPNNCTLTGSAGDPFGPLAVFYENLVGAPIGSIGHGYFLHQIKDGTGNVALLHEDQLVGLYHGDVLAIRADHRRKSLGVPIVLAA